MVSLDAYILSVTAAAILCAIATQLAGKGEISGRITKLICGVIMTLVVVRPLTKLEMPNLSDYFRNMEAQTYAAVSAGTADAYNRLSQRIAQQTRAYILDKAAKLGVSLEVAVRLDDGNPPVPVGITLQGNVPGDVRSAISEIIANDLGIRKEDQIWN